MPLGKPLPPVKEVKPPTQEEIDRAVRNWQQGVPKKYATLLMALPYELAGEEEAEWYWSQTLRIYIDSTGARLSAKDAGFVMSALLIGRNLTDMKTAGLMGYGQLAEGLKSGSLSLADWTEGMRELIRLSQETGILVANGGTQFATQADWQYMAQQIEKQYKYLDGFAKDVADDPAHWLNGRLNNRMRLYQESAYSAYQNALRREAKLGGMDEERRVLGVADHCKGCIEQASQGWQPIGTLDEIGAEECSQNCHCYFEYRNSQDKSE